jgi:hypothetical protein
MPLTNIDGQRLGDSVADKLGNRNLIINGAMNVAQRGTSSTANGYGSVDRFHIQWDGGTTTHTQTAITSGSPYDEGFRNVLRLTNTATANGAGNYRNPFQYIEAQNLAQSGWDYTSSSSHVTLSFWVRSSVAQEFYGYLRTFDGTGQHYSFSLGSLSANTWTKVTKVIPGNSNITINDDNGSGLQVNISPFWGTDFTASGHTTETWASFSSGSRAPDYTDTWANTTNATFDITGVQLEVGNTATPFEHRSYGDELARCQRYTHAAVADGSLNNFMALGIGRWFDASNAQIAIQHPVVMRAVPSLESNTAASTFHINTDGSLAGASPTSISLNEPGPKISTITAGYSSGGRTTGQGTTLYCSGTSLAKLVFSAEL